MLQLFYKNYLNILLIKKHFLNYSISMVRNLEVILRNMLIQQTGSLVEQGMILFSK
jgi:hypothetical protein